MKYLPILLSAALLISLFPAPSQAATTLAYATSVYTASNQLYNPSNALGEPDATYADFMDTDALITLDFGQNIESNLTLHMKLLYVGATVRVDFLDESRTKISSSSYIFQVGDAEVSIPFDGDGTYRYATITSTENEVWKLDAVEVRVPLVEEVEEPVLTEEPVPDLISEDVVERGDLVKLADDENPETTTDAAVYVIDGNQERHAFPNESVFSSWYENFDDVRIISAEEMATYALGKNVTMRPGTFLVKITTDPKVYAVEPDGILRWVSSEDIAIDLYGTDWALRVRDVPDVFWRNYTVGDSIDTTIHPDGTLGVMEEGQVIYIRNGSYYSLPGATFTYMRFNPDYFTLITDNILTKYVDVGGLEEDPEIAFPY